jgi:tRNA (cmo5U34)-methyltransferase
MSTPLVHATQIADTAARMFDQKRATRYDTTIYKAIPGYDLLHTLSAVMLHRMMHPASTAPIAPTTSPKRILAVGVGTGEDIIRLADHFPHWHFVGVDPAPAMLDIARTRLADLAASAPAGSPRSSLLERITLHCGTLETLHHTCAGADEAPILFDGAVSLLVLHFIPDAIDGTSAAHGTSLKQQFLCAVQQWLHPGAPFLLADYHGDRNDCCHHIQEACWLDYQRHNAIAEPFIENGLAHARKDIYPITETRLAEYARTAGFGTLTPYFQAFSFKAWGMHAQNRPT